MYSSEQWGRSHRGTTRSHERKKLVRAVDGNYYRSFIAAELKLVSKTMSSLTNLKQALSMTSTVQTSAVLCEMYICVADLKRLCQILLGVGEVSVLLTGSS